MRRGTSGPWVFLLALGAAAGCAEVLGLDEPTIRDGGTTGSGGGSTSTTTIASGGGDDATTSTTDAVASTGTEATTTTGSDGGGGTGGEGGGTGGAPPTPCRVDADCGSPTICSNPTCDLDAGLCDPGYVSGPLPDDVAGDCHRPACGGASPDAVSVVDDADHPAPLPTCSAGCQDGAVTPAAEGTSCNNGGPTGFCSGDAMGEAACKRCVNTGGAVDPGCGVAGMGPYCDEEANSGDGWCVSCLVADHCVGNASGPVCRQDGNCGCAADAECAMSELGSACTAADLCGCQTDADCDGSPRGSSCEGLFCGCDSDADCDGAANGERCHVSGECFCQADSDCLPGLTCNVVSERCEV